MLVMTTISTAYMKRSIENEDASDSSYDMIRNHRCDLLHNLLSTVDEPLYHLECDNISVVLLLVAMLMIYFQPSHVNYIARAYAYACAFAHTQIMHHTTVYIPLSMTIFYCMTVRNDNICVCHCVYMHATFIPVPAPLHVSFI
jgi:hypothetical protein